MNTIKTDSCLLSLSVFALNCLIVPRHSRSTLGRRAFSVAGPMAWNALPDDLRDPSLSADNFQIPEDAKDASVSECTWTLSALEALRNALYKFKTYLLTYLLTDQNTRCKLMKNSSSKVSKVNVDFYSA